MIIGIGTDCCAIERIESAIKRQGDRFLARVFTEIERAAATTRPEPATYFARRFAAKEACAKALGSGISERIGWCDMEVINGSAGQPILRLSGGARRQLEKMTPKGYEAALHVSLSDDPPMVVAFVIFDALPKKSNSRVRVANARRRQ